MPGLTAVAQGECHAAPAVVAAGAVVVYPPAELGKDQHHYVVRSVVLPQVGEEVVDRAGNVGPQLGMGGQAG